MPAAPADLVMLGLVTAVFWAAGFALPAVLAAHNRNQLARATGAALLVIPATFGLFGAVVAQTASASTDSQWPVWSGLLLGWAIGVYIAVALGLAAIAAIVWPGETERSLER